MKREKVRELGRFVCKGNAFRIQVIRLSHVLFVSVLFTFERASNSGSSSFPFLNLVLQECQVTIVNITRIIECFILWDFSKNVFL